MSVRVVNRRLVEDWRRVIKGARYSPLEIRKGVAGYGRWKFGGRFEGVTVVR